MLAQLLGKAGCHFAWLLAAGGFYTANMLLGIYMLAARQAKRLKAPHRLLHGAVIACLLAFWWRNSLASSGAFWDYLVGAYGLVLLPVSARRHPVYHAFAAAVGLTLLPLLLLLHCA